MFGKELPHRQGGIDILCGMTINTALVRIYQTEVFSTRPVVAASSNCTKLHRCRLRAAFVLNTGHFAVLINDLRFVLALVEICAGFHRCECPGIRNHGIRSSVKRDP